MTEQVMDSRKDRFFGTSYAGREQATSRVGLHRVPGLYRLWELRLITCAEFDYVVHYARLARDGTPLFAVYRSASGTEQSTGTNVRGDRHD